MSSSPKSPKTRWLLPAVIAVLVAAAAAWWLSARSEPEGAYRTATVDRGTVQVTIAATGTLRAISTVEIGSQISGQVISVEVDFNDPVTRGQAIAHLDPAPIRTRVTQAQADLASARASLLEAQATLVNAEADHQRKGDLAGRQLIARAEFDLAVAARDQARARVGSARAVVEQRQAAVGAVELDLDYTVIRSPVDGVVLLRDVEPGQTVAASLQTPLLFEIAEDLSQMQIELTVDESDVGQIRRGQPVEFTVDAFPGRRFRGDVRQVRLAATELNNVVTYPVVVTVDNDDFSLLPGMTANAEIVVSRRDDVLRVPNAALRFRPADAPAEQAGGRRGVDPGELQDLVDALGLDAEQRAFFEREATAMRERAGQERRQVPPQGGAQGGANAGPGAGTSGPGGPAGGGRGNTSPEAMQRMMLERTQAAFEGFRGSLADDQRGRFDDSLAQLLSARAVTVYTLEQGRPRAVPVRAGISDVSHTEIVAGGIGEGAQVVTGQERVAR